jgi:microcystin-dependent protein
MSSFKVKDNVQIATNKNPFFLPGAIISSIVSTVPSGWLNCNGQEVLITQYQNLYSSIGTNYNLGTETVGHFRIPNISSKYLIQKTGTSGVSGSSSSHLHSTSANYELANTTVDHGHPTNNYVNNNAMYHTAGAIGGSSGGTDNNPLNANKTGFSSGGASGAGHTHAVNSGGNQDGPYGTDHGHGMSTGIGNSSAAHSHTGSFTAVNSTSASIIPLSFVVNYFIKT